jgi:hypothetical protein
MDGDLMDTVPPSINEASAAASMTFAKALGIGETAVFSDCLSHTYG